MSKIKKLIHKTIRKPAVVHEPAKPWLEVLTDQPEIAKGADHRIKMTTNCEDSNYIPKVKNAGSIKKIDGKDYQIMHNGVLVESGGYFGDWMTETIRTLKGHHEPQEEKVFYEVLKKVPKGSTMIELGSFWAYYSLWFNTAIKDAVNYCCEPDPANLKLGERNAAINHLKNMNFIQSAAGNNDGEIISFEPDSFDPEEGERDTVTVPIRTIDGIIKEKKLKRVEIVHMDVQGSELNALKGAEASIKKGLIRFVFVSTHHYLISGDPRMHEKCLEFIKDLGGHIIIEHAIHESFSGDGLILASFFKEDAKMKIEVSENRMENNLFRSYTKDLEILKDAYEKLREQVNGQQ